jgi:hypothetical protein
MMNKMNMNMQNNTNYLVVNNKSSAEMYVLPPNSSVILMDANIDRMYVKETDAAGMANLRTYDLVEVKDNPVPLADQYITREEFEEWKKVLHELNTTKQNERGQSANNGQQQSSSERQSASTENTQFQTSF